jgi:hypothetical protein
VRTRTLRPGEQSVITEKALFKMAEEFKVMTKGTTVKKLPVVDDMVVGLRFIILKDGTITIHASYTVGDRRPFMKIGELSPKSEEHLSLTEARELTKAIKAIGDRGIDVEKAQRTRLLAEIKRDGPRWSPALNAPAKK